MRVLILGAGGHGKVVAEILALQGISIIGFLDDDELTWGRLVSGFSVLGGIDRYKDYQPDGMTIGIGSNKGREAIVLRLGKAVVPWITAVHPSAIVSRTATIGLGAVVGPNAVINPDCSIGSHVIINTAATVDHDCVIEEFAHLAPGVHLAGGVRVGTGVFLGIGSSVIPGCVVGPWSVVGAGSTVLSNVPPGVIAKGTPAKW